MTLIAHEDFKSPHGFIVDPSLTSNSAQTGAYGESGDGLRFQTSSHTFSIACNATTVTLGARVYWPSSGDGIDHANWIEFIDNAAGVIAAVSVNLAGEVVLRDANGATVATSVGANASSNAWFTIEVQITMGASAAASVRINKQEVISVTGQDFTDGNTAIVQVVFDGSGAGTTDFQLDWVYLTDATGSYNTGFLGDVTAEYILPDGNGNSSAWVGSDADSTDNYLLVDEDPIADADYVDGATEGDIDLYTYAATNGEEFIIAVQPIPRMALPSGGSRFVRPVTRVSATNYTPIGSVPVPGAAAGVGTMFLEENPATTAAWTAAAVDGAEFGLEVRDT